MHTFTVYGTDAKDPSVGRDYLLPGAWEECTVAHLGIVAALTSVGIAAEADDDTRERAECHLRLCLLHQLTHMADQVYSQIDPSDLLQVVIDDIGAERVALLPQLDWALTEPQFHQSLVPEVVVSKGRKKTTYTGPNDQLARMTVKQWGFCDALLAKLATTGEAQDLHNLLGALYHPEGTAWNNADIEARGAALYDLDDRTKLAAVMNYRGLRNWLAAKYRRAFKGGKTDPHGMQGMVVRLAGTKFGKVDEAYDANLHDVLVHVEQSIADQEPAK